MRIPGQSAPPRLIRGPVEWLPLPEVLGVTGADLAGLRPVLAVEKGARVAAGDLMFSDRRQPWVSVTAPVAGVVSRLDLGPRRSLTLLEIRPEGDDARAFDLPVAGDRAGLVALMVASGLLTALRSRPYGRVPDPAQPPGAIFVTMTGAREGAPDPAALLPTLAGDLARGLAALPVLTDGPTYLCHPPGIDAPRVAGVTARFFAGGLPSTHIHALHPVAHGGMVWQIHWQDVAALGALLETGRIRGRRIVALTGPMAARPGLIEAPMGVALADLAAGRLASGALRLLAGDCTGLALPFLRSDTHQVTAVPHRAPHSRASALRRLITPRRAALIPNLWAEGAAPPGILPVPFLRALAAGDAMQARDLGALGLIEEDLARITARLGNRPDYRRLLRLTLAELEASA